MSGLETSFDRCFSRVSGTLYEGGFLIVFFASLEKETVIKVATDRFGLPNGLTLPPVGVALVFEGPREGTPAH